MSRLASAVVAVLCALIAPYALSQTCTGSIQATPATAVYGATVAVEVTLNNAPANLAFITLSRNNAPISGTSGSPLLTMPAPDSSGRSTRIFTFPSTSTDLTLPQLGVEAEAPHSFTATAFSFTPPNQLSAITCPISPATATLRKLPTATRLDPPPAGSQTFTANVYSTLSLPAGTTVTFKNRDTTLATQTVSGTEGDFRSRTATYTPAATLEPGTYFVTAEYNGDANYLKSRSDEQTLTIAADTSPEDVVFQRQENAPLGTIIESNTVTIRGINSPATITIAFGGYSINNGPYTTAPGTVRNNDNVRLRHTTSCTPGGEVNTTVAIGGRNFVFNSRTAAGAGTGGDSDGDGVPDALECTNGTNVGAKDNDIFGLDAASLRRYVEQVYRDFLGREGDAAGITFWTGEITNGRNTRFGLLSSFFFSPEFQNITGTVARAFLTASNYAPASSDQADFTRYVATYQASPNPATLLAIASELSTTRQLAGLNDVAYITQAFQNAYGRQPTAAEVSTYTQTLNGANGRAQVIVNLVTGASATDAQNLAPGVFVIAAYRAMLSRMPEVGGFNFWTNEIRNGRAQSELLASFYYSPEYGARFVATPPTACTGVVGFAQTTYTATAGATSIAVLRSGGTQAGCSVEVVLCTTSTCGTSAVNPTHYTNPAGFAGSPLLALVTFAANETTKTISVPITTAQPTTAQTLRFSLQNPSWGGLAIGTSATTINFAAAPPPVDPCEYGTGIMGNCLPAPRPFNPAVDSPGKQCLSDGPGPCGAWQIAKPTTASCPSDVSQVWQYNMQLPALVVNADGTVTNYGNSKGFFLAPGQIIAFRFKTPTVLGLNGNLSAVNFGQGETFKFLALSETPCDFDAARISSGNICYGSDSGEVGVSIPYTVSNTPVQGRCTLRPNTHYFLSLRAENARSTLSTGQSRDDCAFRGLTSCGHIIQFGGVQP
jgi:hypothetical protein